MQAPQKRFWWILIVVLAVLIVLAVTAVVIVNKRTAVGSPQSPPPLHLPQQELLSASMRKEPVPGWRTSAHDLGLPPGTVSKLIRSYENRGYFLGITGTGWLLSAIDVTNGRSAFPPVELGLAKTASGVDCFVDGPSMVLCVVQDRDPQTPAHAWMVDADHGTLLYDGPTSLRLQATGSEPVVEQAGNYAVATVDHEGVHGVGAHAELTWFVPGDGMLSQQRDWEHDTSPQPIAVQGGVAPPRADVVFSVADGKVVQPIAPPDRQWGRAYVYPVGFGYEYSSTNDYTWDRVALFDSSGRSLGAPDLEGTILTGSRDIPLVQGKSSDTVVSLDGRKLLELPKSTAMPHTRLIGDRLLIEAGQDREKSWQQFDLRTGKAAKTCDVEGLGYYYIASDGNVAVISGDDTPARAIDLDSCDRLWSLPGETQSEGKDVWKVNTTLIQRTNDELFSLVPPA